jgi:hemerythrin-like domain-containing protein
MARRHPSLVALSQDHHHGLALALRLRQGDAALLADGWTHDRRMQVRHVKAFYEDELKPHFAAEEMSLFPAMELHLPESKNMIAELKQQHRSMESMIAGLNESQSVEQLDSVLVKLGELLEKHIRREERELFLLYEARIADDVAARIQEEVRVIHNQLGRGMDAIS